MDDLHGYYLEDLKEGMSASFGKTVTDADVMMFAGVSGDTNPVHLNNDFASKTMFKGRIAHGMFGAALISAVLGTKLPGPGCIYVNQNLKFKAPVRIGDTLIARVTVKGINEAEPCEHNGHERDIGSRSGRLTLDRLLRG
jgi:3-hydroxybutyryl-CoA dehydratase